LDIVHEIIAFFSDPASGTTIDYAKAVCKVKYSFALELRGDSFETTADQIPKSFNEFWNGMVAMDKAITKSPPF
jgi:hypothetical protein